MKKFLCSVLCLLLLIPVLPAHAVEKSAGLSEDKIIEIVGALEIMQGDENGALHLDDNVTRTEFVKMVICAAGMKDDASAKVAYAPFPDVKPSFWGVGYIKLAVASGYINGYLDGTFKPNGKVTLEEAVTIVLKLLGYTNADFAGSYPEGQLAKYRSLKMDESIPAKRGEALTRRECMYLIYNALCTGTKQGTPICTVLGYAADKDGNIDYTSLIEDKKDGPYLVLDDSWKDVIGFSPDSATYYKDGKTVDRSSIEKYDVIYYSKEFRKIWIYDEKTVGMIEAFLPNATEPESVVISGKTYALPRERDYKSRFFGGTLHVDDNIVLLYAGDTAIDGFPTEKPGVVSELPKDGTVYLNGEKASGEKLDDKALSYVCKELGMTFIYDGNASGILSAILPAKNKPETILLNGKNYVLSENVKELFKNESVFSENDFITLYFGNDGKVEFVENADIYDTDIYRDNGLEYQTLLAASLKGPEIALGDAWKEKITIADDEKTVYYLDGKAVDKSVVSDYDILYWSKTFKTVWIYSDRMTGLLEEISPNTIAPTSVTLAGKKYDIETVDASISFTGKGIFKVGDTVTLLLGKNGGVAAACFPSMASRDYMGISTGVEKKEYTGTDGKTYESYYVNVSAFDGGDFSIMTDDKDFDTGVVVSVSVSGGTQYVKPYTTKYTNVEDLRSAIKNGRILPNAVLVDTYAKTFVKTYAAKLKSINVTESNVSYYSLDKNGYLEYLVLHDATGDCHSYGVIFNNKGQYSLQTSGKNNSISNYKVPPIGAVQIKYNGTEADKIVNLTEYTATSIDGGAVKAGGKTLELWDYAECFVLSQKSFRISQDSDDKLSDVISKSSVDYIKTLISGNGYTVKAYCDSTGIVRVLVAMLNR